MNLTDNFDRLCKEIDEDKATSEERNSLSYRTAASARNVCFVEPDGKRTTYAYVELRRQVMAADETSIELYFVSGNIRLVGRNLGELHDALFYHLPKRIFILEERYLAPEDGEKCIVTEIMTFKD